MPRNGYAHMVLDHYVDRVRAIRAARQERLASIRTRPQARAYQQEVRRAIRRAYGPNPRRTPLNARITGALERRHYRIEKLLFESRPGCLVTAHLYLPAGLDAPAPAVLGTCGHSNIGKLEPLYQEFCQRLARSGFAVLIYDPFNQGERDQYWRLPDRTPVASCTHAHNMMGKQLELIGQWFGAWRAWDGIRALDLLVATGARQVRLYGRGQGALIALCAAMLHDVVKSATLKNAPLAYREWTCIPLVFWPSSCFLRDALSRFDLPDLIRALGRRVRLIQPWGPDMKPLTGAQLKKTLAEAGLPASLIQRA